MLQTYMAGLLEDFQMERENFVLPEKHGLFHKKKSEEEPWWHRLQKRQESCFICERVQYHMHRYFHTFFVMLKDPEFRKRVEKCKGFCIKHFAKLMELAEKELQNGQREWFYPTVLALTEDNLIRVKQDLDWLIAKYDYRNASASWGNARDALPRTMQKIQGIHPADPPYKKD